MVSPLNCLVVHRWSHIMLTICGIFVVGTFEYMLLMSKDTNLSFSVTEFLVNLSWVRWSFFMLNASGNWIIVLKI
jgi:hypothetical protein